jgi:hypothetical protein
LAGIATSRTTKLKSIQERWTFPFKAASAIGNCHLPTEGAYSAGDILFSARDLLERLSQAEKAHLKEGWFRRA